MVAHQVGSGSTGLGLAVVTQQAGINPPSLASAVWGLALGGGVSFGVGYFIGVIKTYVKPPRVNWSASLIAQLHGAMYNSRAG